MSEIKEPDSLPNPETFLLETSLYKSFNSSEGETYKIETFNGPVRAYCIDCDEMSVFKKDFARPGNRPSPTPINNPANPFKSDYLTNMTEQEFSALKLDQENKYKEQNRVFTITLNCVVNSNHKLFFCFVLTNGKLAKIGQYPSIRDLASKDLKKYRKILGNKYGEFSRAIGLFANGIGIGSFTYLRRIFEDLLEQAYQELAKTPNWDENTYKQSRWDERINLLKEKLPNFLVQNKRLYSILSLGIHEMDEETCKINFPLMRTSIELILDEKIAISEKAAKIEAATKGLQNFKSS